MGLFDFFKKKKEELPAKQKEKTDATEQEATSDAVEPKMRGTECGSFGEKERPIRRMPRC